MPGEIEILFSLVGRIHVLLRREINRIIDVEWMCADATYAKEVLKLARGVESEELHKLADRIEEVHPRLDHGGQTIAALPPRGEAKYTTSLR